MNNPNNSFEKGIVESFQDFKVPYKEGSWEKLQAQLGNASSGSSTAGTVGILAILAAACAGIILGWYFFGQSTGAEATSAQLQTLATEREHFDAIQEKIDASQVFTEITYTDVDHATEDELAQHQERPSEATASSANIETKSMTAQRSNTADADHTLATPNVRFPGESADAASDAPSDEIDEEVTLNKDGSHRVEIPAVDGMPAIPISISTREACEGTAVQFSIETEIIDGNYLWNFGDGSFSNNPNPIHTYQKAGTYDITLSVTSNKDGVIRTKTMDQLILVNPNPEAEFVWEFSGVEDGAPVVRFNNKSRRANHATWAIADELNEDINPVKRITSKGLHEIQLVASNEFGCENKVVRLISINEDYALMAPTRFSPNEDGVFDTFIPRALMAGDDLFTMRIYEGDQVIYETSDASKPWTGLLPDGTIAEPGTDFFWEAIIHRAKGDKYYSGEISVVR